MAWSDLPGMAALLDLVCPPRCGLCGADLVPPAGPILACDPCRMAVAGGDRRCAACGAPGAGPRCPCQMRPRDWDGIVVLGPYGGPLRDHVLRAKRPGGEQVATALAAVLVARHRTTLDGWRIDLVTPVPMHWRRRLARGTTAAGQLATVAARMLGLPGPSLLRRVRATPMQKELPFGDRRANVRDAFRASRLAAGRRILLVDDVTTSGATLSECRRALVEAGAAAVYAAVVARADRGAADDGP